MLACWAERHRQSPAPSGILPSITASFLFYPTTTRTTYISLVYRRTSKLQIFVMDIRCRNWTNLVVVLLVSFSHTQALDTATQSINSLDIFTQQKPCAQQCFFTCGDAVGNIIGCVGWVCGAVAPNYCYCRIDLQPVAESYLTSCVKSKCTIGDSSIDISSAGSIYNYYCSSKGYIYVAAATTTTQEIAPASTTPRSTSYNNCVRDYISLWWNFDWWNNLLYIDEDMAIIL